MIAKKGNTKLGDVLKCKKNYTPQNIITIALDGTPYVQTTGVATDKREVALYCDTEEKRILTDDASNNGALITVEYSEDITLKGYIDGKITWREWRDGSGVGKFTLLVKEVMEQ